MSQRRELGSSILRFNSHEEVVKYLRDLCEYYQKESEKYGDKLGSMLRGAPAQPQQKDAKKDDKKADTKKVTPGGWVKMGTLLMNVTNQDTATTEVMYQLHEDLKGKLARTTDALKSLETGANTLFPQNSSFDVFVKNGVPERIVVLPAEAKKAAFNFDAKFRIV